MDLEQDFGNRVFNDVQSTKAAAPRLSTLSDKLTLVTFLHSQKAYLPTLVIPSSTTILRILPLYGRQASFEVRSKSSIKPCPEIVSVPLSFRLHCSSPQLPPTYVLA